MSAKAPPDRRKFANAWDKVGYLYDKLLYWLYQREDAGKARHYAERLAELLPRVAPHHDATFGEECWSLVHEASGDLRKAIKHRKNEIGLIRRLHELARRAPHPDVVLKDYGYEDLSDRLDLLATLYHDSGDLAKAIATLRASKHVCDTHGIKFDGEDMLQECLEEWETMQNGVPGNRRRSRPKRTA